MFMMFMVSVFIIFPGYIPKSALAKHENQHPESRPLSWPPTPGYVKKSSSPGAVTWKLHRCQKPINMWKQHVKATCVIHVCHRLESNKHNQTHLFDIIYWNTSWRRATFAGALFVRFALGPLGMCGTRFPVCSSSLVGEFQVLVPST